MPDKRAHRGPHPDDEELFGPAMLPRLQQATNDLCWLLDRGYSSVSALKLVGDRYDLKQRQRTAISRCACSGASLEWRKKHRVSVAGLAWKNLAIDGYNLLTTVEAALAGGFIFAARDGCYRDMASMHGTWRRVQETVPAIELIGRFLDENGAGRCTWYFDRPVSNSGRLKRILLDVCTVNKWPWEVELVDDPDPILTETTVPIVTADSGILDRCAAWVNLAAEVVATHVSDARIVNLGFC